MMRTYHFLIQWDDYPLGVTTIEAKDYAEAIDKVRLNTFILVGRNPHGLTADLLTEPQMVR